MKLNKITFDNYKNLSREYSFEQANKYIDLVTIYKNDKEHTEVLYDKNTKVMYFMLWTAERFGITPIYNSDGTVKLYDGE